MARLVAFVLVVVNVDLAAADIVYKKDGGKVEGVVITPIDKEGEAERIEVRTKFGATRIPRDQIERIERTASQPFETYQQVAGRYRQTADDQFKLAMWCLENRYRSEYKTHLQKAIELDTNHAEARRRLGYRKDKDQWVTREKYGATRGLVEHDGRLVIPQRKEQASADEKSKSVEHDYFRKFQLWQRWLRQVDEKRNTEANKQLSEIDDPLAVKAAMATFGKKGTPSERAILVAILAKIKTPTSDDGLLFVAIEDDEADNRSAAIAALKPRKTPPLTKRILGYLRDNENYRVCNAADILAEIGDPSVVPMLIDALVTKHRIVYKPTFQEMARAGLDTSRRVTKTEILPDGTMVRRNLLNGQSAQQGLNVGPALPEEIVRIEEKQNQPVRDALTELTGQDLGFDKARWLTWVREHHRANAAK